MLSRVARVWYEYNFIVFTNVFKHLTSRSNAKNEIKHRFETVQRRNAELTYIEWYENSSNNVRLSINVGLLTTFGYLPVMKNFSNHKVRIHDLSDGYEHQTVVTCNLTGEKRSSFRFVNALGKKINDDQWRDCHSKSTCILLLDTFRDRRREKTGGTRYQCYQPKPLKFSRSREWRHFSADSTNQKTKSSEIEGYT